MSIDHNTRSLLYGQPSTDTSTFQHFKSSEQDVFQDVPGLNLKTIEELIGGKVIKAKTVDSVQRMASLNYLSSLLDLRGRLQELGAVFSPSSELITYGNPSSHHEFKEMLALGPMYEEQWNMFFVEYREAELQNTADMWPDLRMLKKILSNNGIIFGAEHLRLNCGDSSGSILRLCEAYDDLRKQWLAMVQLDLPGSDDEELQDHEDYCSGDVSGFDDNSNPSDDTELERYDGSCFSGRNHQSRKNGVPKNVGWRFSDDIEVKTEEMKWDLCDEKEPVTMGVEKIMAVKFEPAAETGSRYRTTIEAFESQPWFAVGVTLPMSRPCTPGNYAYSPTLLQGSGLDHVCSLEHSLSSSQELRNSSMTLLEALAMTPPGYESQQNPNTLVEDIEKPIEFYKVEQKPPKTKWGLRTWLRRAIGHNDFARIVRNELVAVS